MRLMHSPGSPRGRAHRPSACARTFGAERRLLGDDDPYGDPTYILMPIPTFDGRTILCFESRLADETAALIEKYGGRAMMAPSMQEVPLSEHAAVFDLAETLLSGEVDALLCLTGVGTRMMIETMATRFDRERIIGALERLVLITRGPKPAAALTSFGLKSDLKVPEPNTWREVLVSIDESRLLHPLGGKRIAVQEYGTTNEELLAGLRERGMRVERVPIYRWELPDDLGPLKAGLRALLDGAASVVLFTSRTQVDHVMQVADQIDVARPLGKAFDDALVASIGPVCSEGLREHGIEPDFEPSRPKLGFLMRELAERLG